MKDLFVSVGKYFSRSAEWWLLGLGVFLRLWHYLGNRSLWLDEACAAVSVASRSYGEILRHFEVMPEFAHPPMLFMLLERWLIGLFGNNEMALRVFPLFCGVGALVAFFLVTRAFLSRRTLLLAMALFAINDPLVYYSAEIKQYSTDLLVMLGLLWYGEKLAKEGIGWGKAAILALAGAVVLWLSNAMVFMLAAMAAVLVVRAWQRRSAAELLRLATACFVWAVSFAALYFLSLGQMVGNDKLKATWEGALFTGSLFSGQALTWLGQVVVDSFRNPLGLAWPILCVGLFLIGACQLVRSNATRAALYLLPVLLALVAGWLGKYPFRGRVLLFLVPCYLVALSTGVEALAQWFRRFDKWVLALLALLLLAYPVQVAAANLVQGRDWVENRPVMEFFRDHYEPGDFVVMNTSEQPPFWYYINSLGIGAELRLEQLGVLEGEKLQGLRVAKFARDLVEKDNRRLVAYRYEYHVCDAKGRFRRLLVPNLREAHFVHDDEAISGLPAGRTWLILSKAPEDDDRVINGIIRDAFDRRAGRLLAYERRNAAAYLYEMP
ncbi:MAG: hypothetical protein HGA80_01940 [Candidatus Omnitrophica bacterium]|nr:hypothetical protein [Candidatus Omnitrophota bacterium]